MAELDMVNHPPHYSSDIKCKNCGTKIDCIDIIENMPFPKGSAIKYLWRAGKKNDAIEDLKKAIWYINRMIEVLQRGD
jgi:hypothetical protein